MIGTEVLKQQRVGVLMGGLSAEREVSLRTGENVLRALRSLGYDAVGIDATPEACAGLAAQRIAVAFLALHGRYGEDGCVQGLLESLRIPYTGTGVMGSAIAMDKLIAKRLIRVAGLTTPDWCHPLSEEAAIAFGAPLVIKPRREGSSVGLTVLPQNDPAAIASAIALAGGSSAALAERYIAGRELSVAVIGQGESARALGTVEIRPQSGLYDFQAKYARQDTAYLIPAPVPPAITQQISACAVDVHRLFDCAGATRVDFRWDEEHSPAVLEINTLPGMTETSLLPKIAADAGFSYPHLVEHLLQSAALKA